MEFVLGEHDARLYGAGSAGSLQLGGAFTGAFPAVWCHVSVPGVGFASLCVAFAVPSARLPRNLAGISCFRFLNRFTYGNFGDSGVFGLESP
jgi:hypothetical protein